MAPDLAHCVEVVELKSEVVEAHDASGSQTCLDELLLLIVGPGSCLSVGGVFLGEDDADEGAMKLPLDFFS